MRSPAAPALLLIGGLALSGCGTSGIAFQPSGSSVPAQRSIALKVVDNRPPLEGGREPNVVGYRRSLVGIKGSLKESGPQVVTNLVRAATTDALGQSGVGVSPAAPVTLTAQILSFWMDWAGYDFFVGVGYRGAVAVEYTLQDASGRILWKGLAAAEQSCSSDSKEYVFGNALKRIAGRAARRFESEEFRKAVP